MLCHLSYYRDYLAKITKNHSAFISLQENIPMPFPNLMILVTFILLWISFFIWGARYRGKGIKFWGKPTIDNRYFLSGKICLFSSWALLLLKAMLPEWTWNPVPEGVAWFAALLNCAGSVIMLVAFFHLGSSIRVGLPETDTTLQTSGIYSLSRNPIYLGIFLICIASCLFFPNPVNIALTVYGMYMHHRIIVAEEKFLANRFGKAWEDYTSRVRRYL
ncbi:MAG: isoprenylcysteine carboxylmethyltransferase family protein [Bacteroidota bacterium]